MSPETNAEGPTRRRTLPRELSEFLIELSIALHRFAMYPEGHPSLRPVADAVTGHLHRVLESRGELLIGVSVDQLVIEGFATDPKHPVLRDLARRMHDHHLGAVSFGINVKVSEVEDFLVLAAADAERSGRVAGLLPADEIPEWENIHLYPVGYGHLRIREGGMESPAGEMPGTIWLRLAQSAMRELAAERDGSFSAEEVARAIRSHGRDRGYDEVIAGYLYQLMAELRTEVTPESEEVRNRLSELVGALGPETLKHYVELVGGAVQRGRFVRYSIDSVGAQSVMRILEATAASSDRGISSPLVRLLAKLANHAELGAGGDRADARSALRESVDELLDSWDLRGPTTPEYDLRLDAIARTSPLFQMGRFGEGVEGARRVVEVSFEVDAFGPAVARAIDQLILHGEASYLAELSAAAGEGSTVAPRLEERLADPGQLERVLAGEEVSGASLEVLVDRAGLSAVEPLVEAFTRTESRQVRAKVLTVLPGLGPSVAAAAVDRLDDERWYVVRNALVLLQHLEVMPEGFDPQEYLSHPDKRVRREAFPLALRVPGSRERILAQGLSSEDERLVRMALIEMRQGVPRTLVPTLVTRIVKDQDRASEIRALGIRCAQGTKDPLLLEALVGIVTTGRTLLGRRKLADRSPELIAALEVLQDDWEDDPKARPLLEAARSSRDQMIRQAVRSGEG